MARVLEGRNSATPAKAASWVAECNRLEIKREEELAALDAEYKQKKREINKAINADQAAQMDDAKSQGVAKGVIRAMVAEQRDLRKALRIQERAVERTGALDADEFSFTKSLRESLGDDFIDLPLGAAAVEREEAGTTSAVVAAVQANMTDDERENADEAVKEAETEDAAF